MQQCRIGAGVLGTLASGRHSHKGHCGKRKVCSSIPASSFSLEYALRVANQNKECSKLKRGQSMAL